MNWKEAPPEVLATILPWYKLKWYALLPKSEYSRHLYETPLDLSNWLSSGKDGKVVNLVIKFLPETPHNSRYYERAVFKNEIKTEDNSLPLSVETDREVYSLDQFGFTISLIYKAEDTMVSYLSGFMRERYRNWILVSPIGNEFIYNAEKILDSLNDLMPLFIVPYFKDMFYKELESIRLALNNVIGKDLQIKSDNKDLYIKISNSHIF